jgi:hypothetical protein
VPDVYEQAAIFRRELDALDRKAARQMQESYRDAYRVMQARLQAMTNLIEAKKAAGEPVEGRWLFQQERWRQFYSSLRDEIEAYGKIARGITVDAQGKAIEMGQAHTAGLIKSALGKDPHEPIGFAFNKPADKVLRQMVGFAANGLPLSERWGPIAEEARALALKTMQRGVLIGQNPYVLAREMQGPLGVPLWRSMTIARTETLRAYRESQRQTVLANTDILEGWVWHSAKDPRTCEVCWAMDGKLFPIGGGPDTAGHVMASGPAPDPLRSVGEYITQKAGQFEGSGGYLMQMDGSAKVKANKDLRELAAALGQDYADPKDTGFRFTKFALNSDEGYVAHAEGGGVAGALGLHRMTRDDLVGEPLHEPHLYIDYLGSTGIADGTGSALVHRALREAADGGWGVRLEPSDDNAAAFWTKMGMKIDPWDVGTDYWGMTAAEVRRLVEGFGD